MDKVTLHDRYDGPFSSAVNCSVCECSAIDSSNSSECSTDSFSPSVMKDSSIVSVILKIRTNFG